MLYYEVIVGTALYVGSEALTYQYDGDLPIGAVVEVELRRNPILGFIVQKVSKPRFTTKTINKVFNLPPLPSQSIDLAKWLPTYYPSGLGPIGQLFLPGSLPAKSLQLIESPHQNIAVPDLPKLTREQSKTVHQINAPGTYLLHGETGTGKTRVYIELARRALGHNKSVIILTPEISLTPQLGRSFQNSFGKDVIVNHSGLTVAERRNLWLRSLKTDRPLVVIGPRSALFSPLTNIGLIVIDESHEPAYRQEQFPHYHASKVAAKLSELSGSTLVLGSATPSVTDYFLASRLQKPILRMTKLARSGMYLPPKISIVSLRDRSRFNRRQHLSDDLIAAIEQALRSGEQSLLFLNRRGTARTIYCDNCGWQAICDHCNLPLVYHGDSHQMRCHSCGRAWPSVISCPVCGSADVVMKSVGTKAIVDEISTLLPQSSVKRFDTDNKKMDRIEQHYDAVHGGSVDILVGTQLLAKGLDLPKLSVVGIVIADSTLNFPDFSADERTYQLLRQVIGRVGRGHREGSIIIQAYDPENATIQAASTGDWNRFYDTELSARRKFLFPPFCYLLKLTCKSASSKAAQQKATKLAEQIYRSGFAVRIDGPSPSLHEKNGNTFQWQLVAKSKNRHELLKIIAQLPSGWSHDIDPANLL